MFDKQKIKNMHEHIRSLKEENKLLNEKNQELSNKIAQMEKTIIAAENYAAEHREAMKMIELSKKKYDDALKELLSLRKQLLKFSK